MTSKSEASARESADPASESFLLEKSPFYLMAQANGLYTLLMERSLKAVGMDLPRWRVLMVVFEKSPSTITEISKRAVMKLSTMTKVAQRLEKEGFVKLASNKKDARITDVRLLKKGQKAVETIREVASKIYQEATADFSEEEISNLKALLEKLGKSLGPDRFL